MLLAFPVREDGKGFVFVCDNMLRYVSFRKNFENLTPFYLITC